ncbi:hypothetical protein BKA70DRAFT_1560662 [Coprinopsis sp. MPI-PUGE-AT-0042]|nr:hypothetical protein BKA70DRAFT_1560662 [Coprinopsis sp. MPI-PUGE-AT-0042]
MSARTSFCTYINPPPVVSVFLIPHGPTASSPSPTFGYFDHNARYYYHLRLFVTAIPIILLSWSANLRLHVSLVICHDHASPMGLCIL